MDNNRVHGQNSKGQSDKGREIMLGRSPAFLSVLRTVDLIAVTDVTTLIMGASGTGKELLAKHLHQRSRRQHTPFVAVNCAALPDSLVESELFGHRRGAFTGANEARQGRVMAANGGTLFLDEIGELPLTIQSKLLRFLESGECQVLGESHPTPTDVRIIAATNHDLAQQVEAGSFRADLFYRLNVVPVTLPPLNERSEDIPQMVTHFAQHFARQHGVQPLYFARQIMQRLQEYAWPGNIRQLRNLIERLTLLNKGARITLDHLPDEIANRATPNQTDATHHDTATVTTSSPLAPMLLAETGGFTLPEQGLDLFTLERDLILQALDRTGGNKSRAARLLGLTRDTFLYRIKKHALGPLRRS